MTHILHLSPLAQLWLAVFWPALAIAVGAATSLAILVLKPVRAEP